MSKDNNSARPNVCPTCSTCLSPQEVDHTLGRTCAEKDIVKMPGGGLLDLPPDWYDHTREHKS